MKYLFEFSLFYSGHKNETWNLPSDERNQLFVTIVIRVQHDYERISDDGTAIDQSESSINSSLIQKTEKKSIYTWFGDKCCNCKNSRGRNEPNENDL